MSGALRVRSVTSRALEALRLALATAAAVEKKSHNIDIRILGIAVVRRCGLSVAVHGGDGRRRSLRIDRGSDIAIGALSLGNANAKNGIGNNTDMG